MTQEYRYRRYVRWLPVVTGAIFAVVAVVFAAVCALLLWWWVYWDHTEDPDAVGSFRETVIMCVSYGFVLVQSGFVWYICYRIAGVRITVEDDALVYHGRRGEKRLPFDDRMSLRFVFVPYLGGAFVVRSGKQRITVQDSFENKADLLRRVKAALDIRGLSTVYDHERLFRYVKSSEFGDQSWERFWGGLWKLVALMFVSGMLGALVGSMADRGVPPPPHWFIASEIWPVMSCVAAEVIFARRLGRLADPESCTCPARDPVWERQVYRRTIGLGAMLYLLAASVFLLLSP